MSNLLDPALHSLHPNEERSADRQPALSSDTLAEDLGGIVETEYEAGDTERSAASPLPSQLSPTPVSKEPAPKTQKGAVASFFSMMAPALACMGLYSLFFFVDLASGTDIAIFGVRDQATEQRIFSRYGTLIWQEQVRILLTYALLGLGVGVIGLSTAALWDRGGKRRLLLTLGMALFFHIWQLCHAIARFPQIFAESLYDRGGLKRALMLALTHSIPAPLIDGLFGGALLGMVLGPFVTASGRAHLQATYPRASALLFNRRGRASYAGAAGAMTVALLCFVPLSFSLLRKPQVAQAEQAQAPAQDEPAPGSQGNRPSILLLAVDSLRADRVAPTGLPAQIAPNIAALAGRSVRFEQAFVTVPRTFPSFVTLLTGRYPHHHGIRTMFPSATERAQVGPALPRVLSQAGYDTWVFSDFCGEIFSRIDLGFAGGGIFVPLFDVKTIIRQRSVTIHPNLLPYVDGAMGRQVFPALSSLAELSDPELLADQAIAVLKRYKSQPKPFFMTIFFSSAHFPYSAPAPHYRRFTDPNYRGPFRYHKPPWADGALTKEDEAQVRGLYNGAVAAADAALGRVLASLVKFGLAENTIVVLLADHGENLYDEPGRGMGHGDHLEGSHSLQIPLLVYDPIHRFPAHSVPGIVRDIDLAPTLLELIGLPATSMPMDGLPLLPMLQGDQGTLSLKSFSETELWFTPQGPGFDPDNRLPYPGVTATTDVDPSDDIFLSERWRDLVTVAKHRSLRTSEWKLIYRPTRTGVHWSLYDLRKDPTEQVDVSSKHPKELAALKEELLRFLAADPKAVVEGGYVIPQ